MLSKYVRFDGKAYSSLTPFIFTATTLEDDVFSADFKQLTFPSKVSLTQSCTDLDVVSSQLTGYRSHSSLRFGIGNSSSVFYAISVSSITFLSVFLTVDLEIHANHG